MVAYYDEIEIEDMSWDEDKGVYHYPCPCGDRFEISRKQLAQYEDVAICPSCSLIVRVIYDPLEFEDEEPPDDGAGVEEDAQEEEEEEEEEEEASDEEHVADALGQLTLETPAPAMIAAAA